MAYLMHFNKNHDKKGRFTSGDGDGDGKFEYRIRLRKTGAKPPENGSGSSGGGSSGNQWENAGPGSRSITGPNAAKIKTEHHSDSYRSASRNNRQNLRSTQRAIYNSKAKTESQSTINKPASARVREAFKNVSGGNAGRMTENKKIFMQEHEITTTSPIGSERYKEIEDRLKTKNKDERAIDNNKTQTESTRTSNYRKSAEEARSDAEWRQSIDRQTPDTYVDEAKLTAEGEAKATVNYILRSTSYKVKNMNQTDIERGTSYVGAIIDHNKAVKEIHEERLKDTLDNLTKNKS